MVGEPSDTTMAPEWWSRALDDLRAAEILMYDGAPWLVAYHAQQAVEKGIKAYLVAQGVSTSDRSFRVHEIDDLRERVREHDRTLAEDLSIADPLGDYAVEAGYPPAAPGVEGITAEEARGALEIAGEAMEVVHKYVSRLLPDLPAPASPDTRRDGLTR
jgi:HEPN domain-containing protein